MAETGFAAGAAPSNPRGVKNADKIHNGLFRRFMGIMMLSGTLLLGACTSNVELFSDIPESEGNEALAALLDAGLNAHKQVTKDGVSIRISSDEVSRALDTLKALGLPRERFDGMGRIFRKEGLVSSPLEERARYLYALSQELGNTLSQLDGVLVARVHIVLPERRTIGEASTPSSAAVFIKHRRDYTLDALRPQIRQLVAHSIPDLNEGQVAIVLVPSRPISRHNAFTAPDNASYTLRPAALWHAASPASKAMLIMLALLATAGVLLGGWLIGRRLQSMWQHRSGSAHTGKGL